MVRNACSEAVVLVAAANHLLPDHLITSQVIIIRQNPTTSHLLNQSQFIQLMAVQQRSLVKPLLPQITTHIIQLAERSCLS